MKVPDVSNLKLKYQTGYESIQYVTKDKIDLRPGSKNRKMLEAVKCAIGNCPATTEIKPTGLLTQKGPEVKPVIKINPSEITFEEYTIGDITTLAKSLNIEIKPEDTKKSLIKKIKSAMPK